MFSFSSSMRATDESCAWRHVRLKIRIAIFIVRPLSKRWLPHAIGSFRLAVREAGMRWSVGGEAIEIRHVVRVDAIAELVIGRATKSRHQYPGHGAEPDIHHVIPDAAPAERPSCVVAA